MEYKMSPRVTPAPSRATWAWSIPSPPPLPQRNLLAFFFLPMLHLEWRCLNLLPKMKRP